MVTWIGVTVTIYVSKPGVMGAAIVAVYISMVPWVGVTVTVYFSKFCVMGRYHYGCQHFKTWCHG